MASNNTYYVHYLQGSAWYTVILLVERVFSVSLELNSVVVATFNLSRLRGQASHPKKGARQDGTYALSSSEDDEEQEYDAIAQQIGGGNMLSMLQNQIWVVRWEDVKAGVLSGSLELL